MREAYLDKRVQKLYIAMLKNNATARMIEYDSHIDIHVEWVDATFDATKLAPCKTDHSRDPEVYKVTQKDLVSFEKIHSRSKKWLGMKET